MKLVLKSAMFTSKFIFSYMAELIKNFRIQTACLQILDSRMKTAIPKRAQQIWSKLSMSIRNIKCRVVLTMYKFIPIPQKKDSLGANLSTSKPLSIPVSISNH